MNENKDIKKLSENGEQSAEIVSGGVVNEPAESMKIKSLNDICKYEDKKYICKSCKKEFIISEPTGPGVSMLPRRIDETTYCDKCRSKIRNLLIKKVK